MENMKFETILRNVSAVISGILFYLMAGVFYMNAKGFQVMDNGEIVLVRPAAAQETAQEPKEIPLNYAFPQDHALGSADAPVTLYEYSSFACFHCADFHLDVLPKLKAEYIDKGILRVVFVPFPLDKGSMDAALLAECVDEDKYFDFADVLFKKQRDWGMSFQQQKVLMQYAALSGLSTEKAKACLKNDITAARILKDRQSGVSDLGIAGTPSFVVSSKKENEMVYGFRNFDDFKVIIESHLQENN